MLICHRVNMRSQEVSFIHDFGNYFYRPTTRLSTFHAVLGVADVVTLHIIIRLFFESP